MRTVSFALCEGCYSRMINRMMSRMMNAAPALMYMESPSWKRSDIETLPSGELRAAPTPVFLAWQFRT